MPTLTVRNLEDVTLKRLKRRAEAHQRSLEAEVREILARAALPEADELVDEIRGLHDRILARRGGEPLPTDGVRVLATVRDEA
ncbi:MAG: plasmid stabilization protein [Geminicoccaceae bacterium]